MRGVVQRIEKHDASEDDARERQNIHEEKLSNAMQLYTIYRKNYSEAKEKRRGQEELCENANLTAGR